MSMKRQVDRNLQINNGERVEYGMDKGLMDLLSHYEIANKV